MSCGPRHTHAHLHRHIQDIFRAAPRELLRHILSLSLYCHRPPTHTGHFPRGSSGVVAAYIVAELILSPATIYVDVHGTYYRWTAHVVAHRHILSPDGTYCRTSSHIVAGRHILSPIVTYCRQRQHIPLLDSCVVCLRGGGKRQTDRQGRTET